MSKTKVVVIGGSGMLGSMVVDALSRDQSLNVTATVRSEELARRGKTRIATVEWRLLNVTNETESLQGLSALGEAEWYINAVGMTKPYTRDDNPMEIERAVRINALFPHLLARFAGERGGRILQIATDCVYSGKKGHYIESDKRDAFDVYGKTKSLGEVILDNMFSLRCSIVGPEPKVYAFLLEWFRRQPRGAQVSGYTNHLWNGVTTLHFARICLGIIKNNLTLTQVQHIVPCGELTKYDLLKCFAAAFDRNDIMITPMEATAALDRTLATENEPLNVTIWQQAGYTAPPSITQMIDEMAHHDFRLTGM